MTEPAFGPDTQVGDMVCIQYAHRWDNDFFQLTVSRIERLTATQVIAFDGRRWHRKDGREVTDGSWYDRECIVPLTAELQSRADKSRQIMRARELCEKVAKKLMDARGDEALRLAEMLPDALKG